MQWKLLTKHYINDALLEPGTIVGTDTPFSFNNPSTGIMYPPSLNMEPADREAAEYLQKHPRKFDDGKNIPVDLLQTPDFISPGQRIGGLGPKESTMATPAERVPGQGPAFDVDRALTEKAFK